MINTAKVAGRRRLQFHSAEEMMKDVATIEAAARRGSLRQLGNWSPGQCLGHLASWVDYAYDGYPPGLGAPWFIKLILRLAKKRFLRGPLKAGVKIPRTEHGTFGIEPLSIEEGLARFRRAWKRLEASPPSRPNIIFGPMTHEEWIKINLRHAELHLGFLDPG